VRFSFLFSGFWLLGFLAPLFCAWLLGASIEYAGKFSIDFDLLFRALFPINVVFALELDFSVILLSFVSAIAVLRNHLESFSRVFSYLSLRQALWFLRISKGFGALLVIFFLQTIRLFFFLFFFGGEIIFNFQTVLIMIALYLVYEYLFIRSLQLSKLIDNFLGLGFRNSTGLKLLIMSSRSSWLFAI